jgi:hypothetical protein
MQLIPLICWEEGFDIIGNKEEIAYNKKKRKKIRIHFYQGIRGKVIKETFTFYKYLIPAMNGIGFINDFLLHNNRFKECFAF